MPQKFMPPKILYIFGWTLFLGAQALIAWRLTHHPGAAVLTFLWLTVPAAWFVRREAKRRMASKRVEPEISS
jgi:thiol:disulfide interchange protein